MEFAFPKTTDVDDVDDVDDWVVNDRNLAEPNRTLKECSIDHVFHFFLALASALHHLRSEVNVALI